MFAVLGLIAVAALAPRYAYAVDWAQVPGRNITLFYPAQVSWERLFTPGYHTGQKKYLDGKNCFPCHGDSDEKPLGGELVHADKFLEPTPIADKPGSIKVNVKVAHDADTFYVRLTFDPGPQPNAGMDKEFETKVAMMIDDGGVPEMTRAGCWIACHINASSMQNAPEEKTTKYILESRASYGPNGGGAVKPAAALDQLRAGGHYLEYWQAHLNPGKPAVAVDGTILEKRAENQKPAITATATQTNGVWEVTLARKMIAGAPYKDIVPGKTYNVGFSLHAGYTTQRFHYVSFERTLILDAGMADFVAAKQ